MPRARTMGRVLEEIASRSPASTAIIHEHERISYADLNLRVDRAASSLLALGLRRGDTIAALIGNHPEWVVMSFAAARIGAVFAPLNTWHRRAELDWTIRHTDARALICLGSFLGHDFAADLDALIPELARSVPGQLACQRFPLLRTVAMIGAPHPGACSWDGFLELGRDIPASSLRAAADAVSPDDLLIILYTSGSTAEPKGVTLRHRGVVENSFNIGERRGIRASDRVWLGAPLFYALGAVNCLPATIIHGATLVLQGHFTAARAIEVIRRERATVFYGTSNMIRAMVDDPTYSRPKLSSLRGGSAGISAEERRILIEDIGAMQATQSYGLTETYGNATGGFPEDSLEIKLQTAGKPLPGFEFRIVDPQTRRPAPAGQSGLLLVRGYVTDGYFKDPQQTALAIDSDGWFDTGDVGRIGPDGSFYFDSRSKEIIKVGGINVSPTEIEQLLLRHPSVRQAHVVGVPHVHDQMVVAIVERAAPVTEDELRTYVRQVAASFKVPRHVLFWTDAQIPRLATGKVARQKLREDAIGELTAAPD